MGAFLRGFSPQHCAQTRRQVPVTQRERETLEGKPLDTTLIALLQFPSAEAAEAFVNDPEYAPHAAARQAGSEGRFHLIDDTDLAGTIPYLPKG
jgi:uncharacterized protein (DUF1330 family)